MKSVLNYQELENFSAFDLRNVLQKDHLRLGARARWNLTDWLVSLGSSYVEKYRNHVNLPGVLRNPWEAVRQFTPAQLGTLVELTEEQDCSDPRDCIFAILGLFQARTGASTVQWSPPMTTEELYMQAFHYMVEYDTSSRMLGLSGSYSSSDLSLPSCCPNFHRRMLRRIYPDLRDWHASRRRQTIN